ncbi:GGDEF domain-containing response regulator [Anaerosinus sp.]|uniref:GGDEF domain-containing response regulator n=1 Tax=Selenobaculum sp. TaxID=3074374 RepID=UPI0015AB6E02
MADKSVILVIDDNMLICTIVKDILKTKYENIITIQDANKSVAVAKEILPDLILLDVVLISTDGFEICRRLKSNPITESIPVMFVTSESERKIISRCFEVGAVDYIRKPFISAELMARVAVHLESRKHKLQLQSMIREMAEVLRHDELTKLYTRRIFMQELQSYFEIQHKFVLVIADIDNFKRINDTYGHVIGDAILTLVAKALKDNCRPIDIAARWGGEEFIMLFPSLNEDSTRQILECMRKSINEICLEHKGEMISVTTTFGFTNVDFDVEMEKSIAMADKALYYGKKHGKNCCIMYDKSFEFLP